MARGQVERDCVALAGLARLTRLTRLDLRRSLLDPRCAAAAMEAVERLPSKQRVAVRLFYWHESPVEDIAAAMGARPATVRSWLFRARRRLADLLETP